MSSYFISGIGTGIGKTLLSTILVRALQADYWKPVQAGNLDFSDSDFVKSFNPSSTIYPEQYRLTQAMSPHAAAQADGLRIELESFILPQEDNLIIEGAGGLLVPINNQDLIIDLIKHLDLSVILLSQNYLGSINHTLLSYYALQRWGVKIKGIIFNGMANQTTESAILDHTQLDCLGRIDPLEEITQATIDQQAAKFKELLR